MAKRFCMSNILRRNLFLLQITGLWPYDRKYLGRKQYTIYSIVVLSFILIPDCIAVSMQMYFYLGDFEKLLNQMSYASQRSITMVQTIFFLRKIDIMKTIMEQLKADLIQPKTEEYKKVVMNSVKSFFFITSFYFWFCTVASLFFMIIPILAKERRFPFDMWCPLVLMESPWFEILYLHQCLAIFVNHFIHTGVDILCSGLMAIIGSQCEFLRAKLMDFEPEKTISVLDEAGEYIGGDNYDSYFRNIFAHHREILLLSKRVNILFSQLVFGEISLVIILICTALFRLSVVVDKSEFVLVAGYIFAMTLQLFLYCWFGAEVYSKSEKLHSGAFQCNWIGAPISFQKILIFFMHKTATPIKMYALHFFELSTVTFTSIMNSSWSFYVLLQQLNAPEENSA